MNEALIPLEILVQSSSHLRPELNVIPLAVCLGLFAVLTAGYVLMKSWGSDFSMKKMIVTSLTLVWLIPAVLATTFVVGRSAAELDGRSRISDSHPERPNDREADDADAPSSASIHEVSLTEKEDLPSWVSEPERYSLSGPGHVIASRQYATVNEARAEVLAEATERVRERVATEYGAVDGWQPPEHLVTEEVIQREHVQKLTRNLGPMAENATMYRVFAEIDDSEKSITNHFYAGWRAHVVEHRLWALGAVLVMLTTILASTTAYFRLDTLTEGAYRRRLKLAGVSLVTAVGLVVGAVLPFVA